LVSLAPCLSEGVTLPVGLLGLHCAVLLVDEQLTQRLVSRQLPGVGNRLAPDLMDAIGPARTLGLNVLPPSAWGSQHRSFSRLASGVPSASRSRPLQPTGGLGHPAERFVQGSFGAAALRSAHPASIRSFPVCLCSARRTPRPGQLEYGYFRRSLTAPFFFLRVPLS
jgi:hypothetical protein